MDIFILEKIVQEIRETILDCEFRTAYSLPDNTISIEMRGRDTFYLIISASSQFPRIYINTGQPSKPGKSSFASTLNIHLNRTRLTSISQIDGERIIECIFEKETIWEENEIRKLIVEIMGKHSNIILCRDGVIIDAIKRVDSTKSRVRQVLPGLDYEYPPRREIIPFSNLEDYLESFSALTVEEFLIKNIVGIGPLSIEEISARAKLDKKRVISSLDAEELDALKTAIRSFREDLNRVSPVVYLDDGGNPESFYIFPLTFKRNRYEIHKSLISASARYYNWIIPHLLLENRKKSLIKELNSQIESLEKRKVELEEALSRLEDPERWKLYGDILLGFNHQISPGSDKFSAEWSGEKIDIPLDPEKTPVENAQEYYERYRDEKREKEVLPGLISEINKKIRELSKKMEEIERITSPEELEGEKPRLTKEEALPYSAYKINGYDVWVGKNAKSNELITFKLSSPSDIWFHAKGYSGSHVILRTNGKRLEYIPEEVILESARLAAKHSRAKSGVKVQVDYTYRKNVRSAGKKRGNVFYTNYKTIVV